MGDFLTTFIEIAGLNSDYANSVVSLPRHVPCGTNALRRLATVFFGLGVYLLKAKFPIEDKLRFP